MDEKKMKRAGIVAIAVPALTVGTVALVSAYQAGNDFQPFNTDRELQKNQIVFSDDEEAGRRAGTAAGRRKRILEKKYRFHKGQESCFGITEWKISV